MNRTLIYDVGAHTGEDTEFYLKKGYSVLAVEANPALVEGLKRKFPDEVNSGQLKIVGAAIAASPGTIDFYVNLKNTAWSTSDPAWVERNDRRRAPSRVVKVPAVTFDQLLGEHGIPYYLKIDIEGVGLLCLEALIKHASRPAYVSIEAGIEDWSALLREFQILRRLGYDGFQIVDQRDVPSQTPPDPAIEGQYAVHVFPKGSSGLFGREIPGKWLSASDALKVYRPIAINHMRFGDGTLGRAIVRRTPILRNFRRRILPSFYDTHARHSSAA